MGIMNLLRGALGHKDPQIDYAAAKALDEYASGMQFSPGPRRQVDGTMYVRDALTGELVNPGDPDDMAVPHVFTYGSIIAGSSHTYFHHRHDEAMRHSRENALRMRRDPFLMALLRERKLRVLRQKWHIESDDINDPAKKAVCDGITSIIQAIPRLRRFKKQLLEAIWYGRYGAQVKWVWDYQDLPAAQYSGPQGAQLGANGQPTAPSLFLKPQSTGMEARKVLTIAKHVPINGDKIGLNWEGVPYVLVNGAQTLPGGEYVKDLSIYTTEAKALLLRGWWRNQFIIHTYDPDDADYWEAEMAGSIYGVGVRSRIYWADWMRMEYISWIAETFERIGLGLVVIRFDPGNPTGEAKAKEVAKTYSRRSAIVMPYPMDGTSRASSEGIEVVEAPIQGAEIVKGLQIHLEDQIERYIAGQNMSGGKDAENGTGFGGNRQTEFAQNTQADITSDDCEELAETLTGSPMEPGLVSMIARWTYPEIDFPLRLKYNVDQPNPQQVLDGVVALAGIGMDFVKDEVRALTGMRKPREGEETIGGQEALDMLNPEVGPDGKPLEPEPFSSMMPGGRFGNNGNGNGNGKAGA